MSRRLLGDLIDDQEIIDPQSHWHVKHIVAVVHRRDATCPAE
jgi:hypothetical protein